MRSKFSIGGHPLHPTLVAVPIGLFLWTLISDVVYLATDRDPAWYTISQWSGIAAVVTALVAALPGAGDLLTLVPRTNARGMAVGHAVLNLTAVLLFAVAALVMWDDGARDGGNLALAVVLHGIAVAGVAVAGWLGGEMVYRHHLSVVPHDATHAQQERVAHRPRHTEEGQPHIARPLREPEALDRR